MRQALTKDFGSVFSVTVVPTLKDNFSYLIKDNATGALAAVDVNADIDPVIAYMRGAKLLDNPKFSLSTILTTHKHWDHSGGNEKLRNLILSSHNNSGAITANTFRIYGGRNDSIPGATHAVKEGDTFSVGELRVDVLDVPCHTKGHVMYRVHHPKSAGDGAALFTGDTMFIAGLGAFFEGDAQDMCAAMEKVYKLNEGSSLGEAAADECTFIFPGHEYTAGFIKFSATIFPDKNSADTQFIKEQAVRYAEAVAKGLPSVPSSLADEKRQNMFLRITDPEFRRMMNKGSAVQLMDYLYNACD